MATSGDRAQAWLCGGCASFFVELRRGGANDAEMSLFAFSQNRHGHITQLRVRPFGIFGFAARMNPREI
jgi:hypothetical protein